MESYEPKKLLILRILEILMKYSDAEHKLHQGEHHQPSQSRLRHRVREEGGRAEHRIFTGRGLRNYFR